MATKKLKRHKLFSCCKRSTVNPKLFLLSHAKAQRRQEIIVVQCTPTPALREPLMKEHGQNGRGTLTTLTIKAWMGLEPAIYDPQVMHMGVYVVHNLWAEKKILT